MERKEVLEDFTYAEKTTCKCVFSSASHTETQAFQGRRGMGKPESTETELRPIEMVSVNWFWDRFVSMTFCKASCEKSNDVGRRKHIQSLANIRWHFAAEIDVYFIPTMSKSST